MGFLDREEVKRIRGASVCGLVFLFCGKFSFSVVRRQFYAAGRHSYMDIPTVTVTAKEEYGKRGTELRVGQSGQALMIRTIAELLSQSAGARSTR